MNNMQITMADPTASLPQLKSSVVTEVPAGGTAILNCNSNDYNTNFLFWILDRNKVIGPGNEYDEKKYKYEVLSGKLHINNVSPTESGYYKCLSKRLDSSDISVGEVQMIVKNSGFTAIDTVKVVAIIISIIVIIVCAVLYYRLRREWRKYEGRSAIPVDETEDDDGDEIYNRTTTAITQAMPGPSRNLSSEHLLYGIENHGLDTDFNSVFENIQIKSPQGSLI